MIKRFLDILAWIGVTLFVGGFSGTVIYVIVQEPMMGLCFGSIIFVYWALNRLFPPLP